MNWCDVIGDATRALIARPLRGLSMMLGIIIGVASLITMLSIGSGAKARIETQIAALGANLVMVLPGASSQTAEAVARQRFPTLREVDSLRDTVPGIAAAAPALQGNAQVVRGNRNRTVRINGTTQDYFVIRDWPLAGGRIFTQREEKQARKVAVIGQTVANKLFGSDDPVGQQIRMLGTPIEVIGVLAPKGQSAAGRDQDDIVFLPYPTARLRIGPAGSGVAPDAVSYALIKAATPGEVPAVAHYLRDRFKRSSAGPSGAPLRVVDPAAALNAQRGASRTVSWLLSLVASVSLIAGGISIMNTMMATVTERRGEIGLRMAIGARPRDVAWLFVVEGVIICLVGGILGVALGAAGAELANFLTGWQIDISLATIALPLGSSCLIGVVFSYVPARSAAQMEPVVALSRQ
ncbi:ABC transporter permease [Leisingera caerulea]|uniref:ABC transporter permease n=1 Tax=Leisingera caerulea TaxID=506591 RepID=A0A9Q9HIV3_LEICA|nr:ABC transporter permease [Leisingera caerulea]UWQ55948.1 ABC transporter permease [Leisingera caerulea]